MYQEPKRPLYFPRQDVPIGLWRLEGQSPVQLHDHDYLEIAIVETGKGMHQFNDDVLPIETGDVFVMPPDCKHAWVETDDLTVINVMVSDLNSLPFIDDLKSHEGFAPLFLSEPSLESHQRGQGRIRLDLYQLKEVIRVCGHVNDALRGEGRMPAALVTLQLLYLLTILCDAYVKAPTKNRQITLRASHVIRYLEDHYSEEVNCDQLAERMHVSTATFYRLFRQATGSSPIQYLNSVRIEQSCRLLRTTDKQILEIAFDVGFNDANYFSRYFKKVKGMSPAQYRAEHLETL